MKLSFTKGIDEFAIDVNLFSDEKVIALITRFGSRSIAVFLNLLCSIYHNGYYLHWDDISRGKIDYLSYDLEVDEINAIVAFLVECNFFNKESFADHSILTSVTIQQRYFAAVRCKDADSLPYLLIEVPKKAKTVRKSASADTSKLSDANDVEQTTVDEELPDLDDCTESRECNVEYKPPRKTKEAKRTCSTKLPHKAKKRLRHNRSKKRHNKRTKRGCSPPPQ